RWLSIHLVPGEDRVCYCSVTLPTVLSGCRRRPLWKAIPTAWQARHLFPPSNAKHRRVENPADKKQGEIGKQPEQLRGVVFRLIVRGTFKQFPTVKIVGSHLGGGICDVIGRMDYAFELRISGGLGGIGTCPWRRH